MPTFNSQGQPIFYCDDGSGEAVLLTHGYGASSAMWTPQVQALCPDYRLLRWDMRGHGQSAAPDDAAAYSEALTVADMLQLLDDLGIERVHLGGLSLGGYMSLAFLLAHPERVQSLMLFSCGPGFKSEEARAKWNRFANKTADKLDREGLDGLAQGPETEAARHSSVRGLVLAARGMLAQFDDRIIQSLPGIQVPTLILAGDKDTLYHTASDYMTAKIPSAQKVLLADAGHASNMDQPQAFNQAVRQFLQNL